MLHYKTLKKNSLSLQLGEQLLRSVPASGVDVVELEDEGTCVRFSPLLTAAGDLKTWTLFFFFFYSIFFSFLFTSINVVSFPWLSLLLPPPPPLQFWEPRRKMSRSWWRSCPISCQWWAPQCACGRISERRCTDTAPLWCTWTTWAGLAWVLSGKAVLPNITQQVLNKKIPYYRCWLLLSK